MSSTWGPHSRILLLNACVLNVGDISLCSVIKVQAELIPLCAGTLGIFHDKVMTSSNEINTAPIFMENN
jgi:hypothetical protein